MFVNNKLFIHIPKTAGSSMEYFLGQAYGYTYEYIDNCIHSLEPNNILHLGNDQQHNPIHYYSNIPNIDFIFTIVRNPYTRLLSAYSFFKEFIETMNYNKTNLSLTEWFFSGRETSINSVFSYNNHLLPQHWYLQNLNKFSYIYKYENLQQDIEHIKNQLKINIPFPHTFRTIKHYATMRDISPILSEVNNYYEKDFNLFHYQTIK